MLQTGRKYLHIYLKKDLYPEYIKNSYNSTIRLKIQLKHGQNNRHFIRVTNNHMKNAEHH